MVFLLKKSLLLFPQPNSTLRVNWNARKSSSDTQFTHITEFTVITTTKIMFFLSPPPSPKLFLLCLHSLCLLLNPPPHVWEHSDHSDQGVTTGQGEGEHGEVSIRGRRQGLASELRKAAGSTHSLDLEKKMFMVYSLRKVDFLNTSSLSLLRRLGCIRPTRSRGSALQQVKNSNRVNKFLTYLLELCTVNIRVFDNAVTVANFSINSNMLWSHF